MNIVKLNVFCILACLLSLTVVYGAINFKLMREWRLLKSEYKQVLAESSLIVPEKTQADKEHNIRYKNLQKNKPSQTFLGLPSQVDTLRKALQDYLKQEPKLCTTSAPKVSTKSPPYFHIKQLIEVAENVYKCQNNTLAPPDTVDFSHLIEALEKLGGIQSSKPMQLNSSFIGLKNFKHLLETLINTGERPPDTVDMEELLFTLKFLAESDNETSTSTSLTSVTKTNASGVLNQFEPAAVYEFVGKYMNNSLAPPGEVDIIQLEHIILHLGETDTKWTEEILPDAYHTVYVPYKKFADTLRKLIVSTKHPGKIGKEELLKVLREIIRRQYVRMRVGKDGLIDANALLKLLGAHQDSSVPDAVDLESFLTALESSVANGSEKKSPKKRSAPTDNDAHRNRVPRDACEPNCVSVNEVETIIDNVSHKGKEKGKVDIATLLDSVTEMRDVKKKKQSKH